MSRYPHGEYHSCVCGHMGRWHRGRCRITDCDCEAFVRASTFESVPDGSWMPGGRAPGERLRGSAAVVSAQHPTRDARA